MPRLSSVFGALLRARPAPLLRARPPRRARAAPARALHRTHARWWKETPSHDAREDLRALLAEPGTRRALTAALELSVERCVQAYDETGRAESLERWLASELGENLLEDEREHRAGASPRRHGITPAGFLRRVLRDGAGVADPSRRADPERVARTLAAELKRRFESRRATLRERHVCITWRRQFTNLSTMSRAASFSISPPRSPRPRTSSKRSSKPPSRRETARGAETRRPRRRTEGEGPPRGCSYRTRGGLVAGAISGRDEDERARGVRFRKPIVFYRRRSTRHGSHAKSVLSVPTNSRLIAEGSLASPSSASSAASSSSPSRNALIAGNTFAGAFLPTSKS